MKKIAIGFSPCPNDTFIFDALVNKRIDTKGFQFDPVFEDVEELNQLARKGILPITKISVGAYPEVSSKYVILNSGGALGLGVGPILVSKTDSLNLSNSNLRIAIPGKFTTANLLLSIFFPHLRNKSVFIFSEIENMVLSGKVDAGILIHEGRFTYSTKGLVKHLDLGEVWENTMHVPLPLGCICINRDIELLDRNIISDLIKESILFAFENPDSSKSFIKTHSQEIEDDVIQKHISLYVNKYSLDLGDDGRSAIEFLLNKGMEGGLLPSAINPIFNDDLK